MAHELKEYFPMIRTKAEILQEIQEGERLREIFESWNEKQQEEFLNFTSGMKGVKILYDSFFKEVFNPEVQPERLEAFLSLLLKQKIKIRNVLPNDNSRIADESSHIKKVYTIVLFETSTGAFHTFPENYVHRARQETDTGLPIDLLQEYILIPLDIFRQNLYNRGIKNQLDAWLTFLSVDDPEWIVRLIQQYPEFVHLYNKVYSICENTEKIMGIFSEELKILDKNTVQLMIDEMQDTIDTQEKLLNQKEEELSRKDKVLNQILTEKEDALNQKEKELRQKEKELRQKDEEIASLKKLLGTI